MASSEGANNVVLAQIYNDLCPVQTPPQEADPRVRQTIDGHPIAVFWNNGSETVFYGKMNFNHDKGAEEVFGFTDGDESWEILQNGTERTGFRSADFSGDDWKNDFEARYPEDNVNITNLQAFAEWLVSTDTNAATDEALEAAVTYDDVEYTTDSAEYRLAKFKAEASGHMNVDAMVYYYVITELFLCIDQREKNAFPTLWSDDPNHWMMLFYDADSSLGIDNKGNLAFDYYLEDIDYTEAGDPVFNGQASVLWVNLRKCFYSEIEAEYKRLRTTVRSDGSGNPLLSYDVVNDLFEAHQGKWSEAIYNEDGYRKSIEPYALNGDTLYLPMLQGKKEQQRKWWLYNRFRYLDSKYNTGSSMETRITMRAHAQANITLVSYVNMYGHVYYNAEMAEHRMYRGQEYEFEWAATGAEDAVIGINDADMLVSMGDMSPLMLELIDISKATHLTSLKIGDASEDYVNRNLNSITLGNNILMRTLDLRNCVNLTQNVDASGCINIEEIYCDGTAVTGVSVPNGGNLRVLHLPNTVTNLTICNQTKLSDFVLNDYSNVATLRIENTAAVPALDVLMAMSDNGRIRLLGVDTTFETSAEMDVFIAKLKTMRGLDENGNNVDTAQITGTVHAAAVSFATYSQMDQLSETYPNLNITYDEVEPALTHKFVMTTLTGEYYNDRITTVGARAFSAQAKLSGVTLPNVTSAGESAFEIAVWDNDSLWKKIDLPNLSKVNGNKTFAGNKYLSELNLPSLVNANWYTFQETFRSKSPTIVDFPEMVSVSSYSFQGSNTLKMLRFRKCVSFNGMYATMGLHNASVILDSETLCILNDRASSIGGYIYVPAALVDSYKVATNWSTYADRFRALEDYTVDGTISGDLDETKI